MTDEKNLSFVKDVIVKLLEVFPEETYTTINDLITGYGGELFGNRLYCAWDISDVKSLQLDLTDEQCREVLSYAGREFDANVGINWETLNTIIFLLNLSKSNSDPNVITRY